MEPLVCVCVRARACACACVCVCVCMCVCVCVCVRAFVCVVCCCCCELTRPLVCVRQAYLDLEPMDAGPMSTSDSQYSSMSHDSTSSGDNSAIA